MEKIAKHIFISVLVLTTLVVATASCHSDADSEPSSGNEEYQVPPVIEPFYGVGPLLNHELVQIAMADTTINNLVEDEEHIFVFDGQQVTDQNYNLSVGVRLKDNVTPEQFNEWMDSGREDSDLIIEYVGVLNIGYNMIYDITFDMEKRIVSELTLRQPVGNIPEASAEDKQRALNIASVDPVLKQVLEGKSYRVAPDNKIGVWHTGETKLGVAFEISFDLVYTIDAYLPVYQGDSRHFTGEVEGLVVSVLLEEERVAGITPISPMVNH